MLNAVYSSTSAPPTAELEPITQDYTQLDEVDMGMSYLELQQYGQLRKQQRAGPVSMFRALVSRWGPGSERGLAISEVNNAASRALLALSCVMMHGARAQLRLSLLLSGVLLNDVYLWNRQVAAKVKKFFFFYSINRHKMTTLTPAYHAEDYCPEDNRHDLRQFLYNPSWKWQFRSIDTMQEQYEREAKMRSDGGRLLAPPR
jgi:NAD+ synthase (glutamine-hydrolysing)